MRNQFYERADHGGSKEVDHGGSKCTSMDRRMSGN